VVPKGLPPLNMRDLACIAFVFRPETIVRVMENRLETDELGDDKF
jgi:hypothetical protein